MYKGEWLNTITHSLGALAAVGGLIVLVVLSTLQGDPWKIVSFSIYGATLLLLYTSSSLYHAVKDGPSKSAFRRLDYSAIYLLIAGTYTPFTLVTLRGRIGWTIFGIVWGLAAIGITLDLLKIGKRRILQIAIYLMMGWAAMISIRAVIEALPPAGFTWLIAGGLLYTFGIVFYLLDKRIVIGHGIWHLFVLGGSISHFVTIIVFVA
jgi:hemolysin III